MSLLKKLRFDKMDIDTSLAQEYFKKKNNHFYPIHNGECCIDDSGTHTSDPWNNKIYFSKKFEINHDKLPVFTANNLWQLAQKIEEHGDLLCQLEHLICKQSINECKNRLQILIRKCQYWGRMLDKFTVGNEVSEIPSPNYDSVSRHIISLVSFASVIDMLIQGGYVVLKACPNTAAISTLFTELCAKVGLANRVFLDIFTIGNEVTRELGCTGIVTETADLDSAVHAFIESPTNSPWQLSKVLVQESIYEAFQKALQWKCSLNGTSTADQYVQNLKSFCTDVQVGGGKMFLLDYVGGAELTSVMATVVVEAYRTSKELLTIMSKTKVKFVSLWASDASQANEIAVSLSAPLTWINSYGVFSGPPEISESLTSVDIIPDPDNDRLKDIADAWVKLDLKKRQDAIAKAVQKVLKGADDHVMTVAVSLQTLLRTHKLGFVEVNKNDMWIGVEKPAGLVHVGRTEDTGFFVHALVSSVYGNRVVLSPSYETYSLLVRALEEAGVPICIASEDLNTSVYKLYNVKVIYTNFGTIFAN